VKLYRSLLAGGNAARITGVRASIISVKRLRLRDPPLGSL
jgi:hypothetical protein